MEEEKMKNSTTSPLHYKSGKIEVITILRKKMTAEQFKGFCIGNVLKYVMRAEYKKWRRRLQEGNSIFKMVNTGGRSKCK